jgi:hypothetical protein
MAVIMLLVSLVPPWAWGLILITACISLLIRASK